MAHLRTLLLVLAVTAALPAGAHASLLIDAQGGPVLTGAGAADGVLSGGDSFELAQSLQVSENGLTSLTGTLSTSTPGVSITRSASTFPDPAFGGTTTNTPTFRISLAESVSCGTSLSFGLGLASNLGTHELPITVGTGLKGPLRRTEATEVPRAIPDSSSITSSIEVPTPGLVKDVRVHIGQIAHDYVGDLRISLEAPDGTTVVLFNRRGGLSDGLGLINTTFASSGASLASGAAPFTGTYQADGDLSEFTGRQQQGTWKLHIADQQFSDSGTLVSWGASIAQAVCTGDPIPTFSATPNPVAPGATAVLDASGSFDPSVGGSIVRYEWDLDGNGSFERDNLGDATVDASWPTRGTVQVGLRVTDDEGNTENVSSPVLVTVAPQAALGWAPTSPQTGEMVTLDAAGSTDADGTIEGYAWDVDGNGSFERNTGTVATTTASFATPGTHVVRVRVTDDTGATDVERVEIVATNRAPTAALSHAGVPVPGIPVTLDASGSSDPDGSIATYEWDLDGDGSYETFTGPLASAQRTFPASGNRTVGVRVTDDQGATAIAAITVSVDAPPLPSLSVAPSPATVGSPVAFNAQGSTDPDGSISRYEWDLDGDGTYESDTQTLPVAGHIYTTTGTRTVRLRITDDRGVSAVATSVLRVDPAPATASGGTGTTGGGTTGDGTSAGDGATGGTTGLDATRSFTAALLGAPIQALRLARSQGIGVSCQANEAARCAMTAYLKFRKRTRFGGRLTLLAPADGEAQGRIVLSRPARRALKGRRSVRVVLRGSATDELGRRVALVRVVLLRTR